MEWGFRKCSGRYIMLYQFTLDNADYWTLLGCYWNNLDLQQAD